MKLLRRRRGRGPEGNLGVGGRFKIQCFDKDGNLKWEDTAKNGVVNGALDSVLDVYLRNQTQIASWYLGLISNSGFTELAAADTLASHGGWTEAASGGVAYSGNRPQWSPSAASSQSITNGTSVDFSITATVTIRGVFLCSVNTGTSGTLFATALFSGGNQSLESGDTLKVTYTVNASAT